MKDLKQKGYIEYFCEFRKSSKFKVILWLSKLVNKIIENNLIINGIRNIANKNKGFIDIAVMTIKSECMKVWMNK